VSQFFRRLTLTAGLLLLAAPGSAQAASIEANPIWLSFIAAPGEVNDLTVTQSGGQITFNDPGKTLDTTAAGGQCGAPSGGEVTCSVGARELKIELGDADDEFVSTATTGGKVSGGDGVDTVTGGPGVEKLSGDAQNDTLNGGGGGDKLDGLDGVDTLNGGPGADQLSGGTENDTLDGGGDADRLDGGFGLDTLRGGTGDDRLTGGPERDTYEGGAGRDILDWSDQTTPVTADFDAVADDGVAGTPELLPGDVEEVVGGSAADHLSAGPAGTALRGNAGADTLTGGLGNDRLYGGADGDALSGGGGTDAFYGDAGADRVLARDGVNEVIACGTEADFAEIDPLDVVDVDCETVDDGGTLGGAGTLPPPQIGRSVTVAPARGVVKVRQPGGRTVVLRAGDDIPVGSVVDTRKGAVKLTSASNANGGTQTAQFSHGIFQVRQPKTAKPVTELVLKGKLDCGTTAKRRGKVTAARGPHGRRKRRLWGSGHGRFRTRGRRSSATVRGTIWLTEDRCSGTYTKVRRGVVAVKDFRTGKTKLVRAGKSYLAKTKRKRR
jgi:Ca2+-binding RTX toxin-like protein